MKNRILAKRYAKALFGLLNPTKDKDLTTLKQYSQILHDLSEALLISPPLVKVLHDPVISLLEKKQVLQKLLKLLQADQTMINFCALLADHNRLDLLGEIAVWFGKLLDQSQNIVRGQVVTAIELKEKRQEEIRKTLAAKSKAKLVLDFTVEPNILGGLIVRLGDKVLDASLRATLIDLRQTLSQVA